MIGKEAAGRVDSAAGVTGPFNSDELTRCSVDGVALEDGEVVVGVNPGPI